MFRCMHERSTVSDSVSVLQCMQLPRPKYQKRLVLAVLIAKTW